MKTYLGLLFNLSLVFSAYATETEFGPVEAFLSPPISALGTCEGQARPVAKLRLESVQGFATERAILQIRNKKLLFEIMPMPQYNQSALVVSNPDFPERAKVSFILTSDYAFEETVAGGGDLFMASVHKFTMSNDGSRLAFLNRVNRADGRPAIDLVVLKTSDVVRSFLSHQPGVQGRVYRSALVGVEAVFSIEPANTPAEFFPLAFDSLKFSPDGNFLVAHARNSVEIFELSERGVERIPCFDQLRPHMTVSKDEETLKIKISDVKFSDDSSTLIIERHDEAMNWQPQISLGLK